VTGPVRVQRRRTRGWRMPAGAVYVGRPTRWGNPFRPGDPDPADPRYPISSYRRAVDLFELHTGPMGNHEYDDDTLAALRTELGGRDLVCWCPADQPCHADVLLRLANDPNVRHL